MTAAQQGASNLSLDDEAGPSSSAAGPSSSAAGLGSNAGGAVSSAARASNGASAAREGMQTALILFGREQDCKAAQQAIQQEMEVRAQQSLSACA